MTQELAITFGVLAGVVLLLLFSRLRADLVALLVVVTLGVTGVLSPAETFSGFSRSAVITIMAIFILAEGLRRTGVTDQAGLLLLRLGGTSEARLIAVITLAGAFLSLLMNNIAAAAVLLPAVAGLARRSGVPASRLLMPLGFGTILGGMATLFTTTNIVVSGVLREQGFEGFGVLDFVPVGGPAVVVGTLYLVIWGRHRLPRITPEERLRAARAKEGDLVGIYRLGERVFRARIPAGSRLHGRPLAESGLRETYRLEVVAIERGGERVLDPGASTALHSGDVLLLCGRLEEFRAKDVEPYLEIMPARELAEQDLESPSVVLVEAVLAPRSTLIGHTLRDSLFRMKYGMTVLAIWRAGRPIRTGLADLPLEFGDALLLKGPRARVKLLEAEPTIIVLGGAEEQAFAVPAKGWVALGIMTVSIVLAAVQSAIAGEILLGGALAMMLSGILTNDQAYAAVEWRSVFLVAGMLPLGIAMLKTGAATMLGTAMINIFGGAGPVVLLLGFFVFAMALTQVMHGAAVSALVAPIAIQTAREMGLEPYALAMGVALATSMAFLTPLGHPVNVLVMAPAGYRISDYVRVGFPLTLLLTALIVGLVSLVW